MKYTREEMYASACNDSEKMFKLKALDYLEWLIRDAPIDFDLRFYWTYQGPISEAIRAAIKEVCKP